MRYRLASCSLAACMFVCGCACHPPYGEFNDNTSIIPPLGKITHRNNLPPAKMLMEPGPGVGGPGPGVMIPPGGMDLGGGPFAGAYGRTSQIHFKSPEGMQVRWDVSQPGAFDGEALITPAR